MKSGIHQNSNPVYIEKYLRTKTKFYKGKININFHNIIYINRIPKEGSQYICLSVILFDSIFKTGKNYYPQGFLEECKYVIKEKKIEIYVTDVVEISDSDEHNFDEEDSSEEDFGKEDSSEEDSDEKN